VNSQRNAPTRRSPLFQRLRSRIAGAISQVLENAIPLPILGAAVGVVASFVVVSFKATIAFAGLPLVGLESEDFEALPTVATVLLPLASAAIIGASGISTVDGILTRPAVAAYTETLSGRTHS